MAAAWAETRRRVSLRRIDVPIHLRIADAAVMRSGRECECREWAFSTDAEGRKGSWGVRELSMCWMHTRAHRQPALTAGARLDR